MNNTRKKKAKISTKVIYVFLSILAVIYSSAAFMGNLCFAERR